MICRFWCKKHKDYHFLAEMTDDLDTAACMELGEQIPSCDDGFYKYLAITGIHVRNPQPLTESSHD